MMNKRIPIVILTMLFLVSTTGLPVTYNLCKMMQEMSLNKCEMCSVSKEEVVTSCCAEEIIEYALSISSENPVCCQTEVVFNKVEDQYVDSKTEINFYTSSQISLHLVAQILSQSEFNPNEPFLTDSSPPFLIDSEIHLTNSVLLI